MSTDNELTPYHELMKTAISSKAGIDELAKLMDLQERWESREAAKSFKAAFAAFQAEAPELIKDREVIFKDKIQYKFISLASIQKAINPITSKNGLSYRWEQVDKDEEIGIVCIVSHVDGHEERTTLYAKSDGSGSKNSIQGRGSTVSYLKRYTLEAALGLSSDVYDDGTTAGEAEKKAELTPEHKRWEGAKKALQEKTVTLEEIKSKFFITETNEKLLTSKAKK